MEAVGKVELINNTYIASVATRDWGTYELELLTRYSEPVVETGGTFTVGTSTFSITDSSSKVKSQSPFVQRFDITNYDDAGDRAVVWMNDIIDRLVNVLTTFRDDDTRNYKGTTKIKII